MKKTVAAILAFSLTAGLLLFCIWGRGKSAGSTFSNIGSMSSRSDEGEGHAVEETSGEGIWDNVQENKPQDEKKIALTFDDEVIIGLSQEADWAIQKNVKMRRKDLADAINAVNQRDAFVKAGKYRHLCLEGV